MLGALFGMGQGMGLLGSVTQAPLTKACVRYWWVSLPLAYLVWHSYRKRKAAGTLDPANLIGDIAPAATLAMSLVLIDLTLRSHADNQPAAPVSGLAGRPAPPRKPVTPAPLDGQITDAEFTPRPTPGARYGLV